MHLDIPDVSYFKGGFIIQGNFDHVPVRNEACLGLSTNGADMLGKVFAPEILRAKIAQLDFLYDHVEMLNPTFASYFIKPTDLINTFAKDGITGVAEAVTGKKDHFLSKTPSTVKMMDSLQSMTNQFVNHGGKEGISDQKKWDDMDAAERKDFEWNHHLNGIKENTDPFELMNLAYKAKDGISDLLSGKTNIIGESMKNLAIKKNSEYI